MENITKKSLCLFLVIASVLFAGGFTLYAQSLTRVNLLLDWVPNTNHTGIYVAYDKGWYHKEGLDLKIIQPGGNMSVLKVVGAGKADFGISSEEFITSAREAGVPVVSLAAIIQHDTSGFASLASENIKTPADFVGKIYGGWGMKMEEDILKSLINGSGGDFAKLKQVNVGDSDPVTLMAQHKIDLAWIFYGWEGIQARLRGLKMNFVMLKDYQDLVPDYYTPTIITSEKMIAEKPDIVRKFMAATARGYNYAIAYPDQAASILMKYSPESDPSLIKESQEWLSPRYRDNAAYWGEQKLSVWQRFGEWMYDNGQINDKFSAKDAFTNKFLPNQASK